MALSDILPKPSPAELKDAGVAPVRNGVLNPVTDWPATRAKVDELIKEAHARREALVASRDELLVESALGEKSAVAKADNLDAEISDLDRQTERLWKAAGKCDERIAAEAAARKKAEIAERWAQFETLLKKREEKAHQVQAKCADFVAELEEFAALGPEMFSLAPARDANLLDSSVLNRSTAFALCSLELRRSGATWMMSHLSSDDMSRVPPLTEKVRDQHGLFLKAKGGDQ